MCITVRTHALYISYNVFIKKCLIFTHIHSKTLLITYFVRVLNGMKHIENKRTETSSTFSTLTILLSGIGNLIK